MYTEVDLEAYGFQKFRELKIAALEEQISNEWNMNLPTEEK
jgi:hypothetical protein